MVVVVVCVPRRRRKLDDVLIDFRHREPGLPRLLEEHVPVQGSSLPEAEAGSRQWRHRGAFFMQRHSIDGVSRTDFTCRFRDPESRRFPFAGRRSGGVGCYWRHRSWCAYSWCPGAHPKWRIFLAPFLTLFCHASDETQEQADNYLAHRRPTTLLFTDLNSQALGRRLE
jgi:hypothetical protein